MAEETDRLLQEKDALILALQGELQDAISKNIQLRMMLNGQATETLTNSEG